MANCRSFTFSCRRLQFQLRWLFVFVTLVAAGLGAWHWWESTQPKRKLARAIWNDNSFSKLEKELFVSLVWQDNAKPLIERFQLHRCSGPVFERREAQPDLNRRVKTSGHILEWLSYAVPEEELQDAWVTKAVDYLAGVLEAGKPEQWEIGPLGHALHGLAIYDRRVFKEAEKRARSTDVAKENSAGKSEDKNVTEGASLELRPATDTRVEEVSARGQAPPL